MAEALVALSLACSVFQVISFSKQTISVCKKLYDGQSVDENLEFLARHLHDLSKDLDDSLAARGSGTALTGEQRNLQDVAQKCLDASTKLKKELSKFNSTAKQNWVAAVGKGLKKTMRKGKIEEIEKSLMECQSVLQTRLLTQLCDRTEAASLELQTGFHDISERTRDFIRQYASGCTKIEDLLAKQGADTRSYALQEGINTRTMVTHESRETRGVVEHESGEIRTHVTMESQETRRNISIGFQNVSGQANCEKLLASLKYNGMNARRNEIGNPEGKTFTWIFDKESQGPWDNFAEWLGSNHPIYWVSGKAGSGKSTLMKFVAESPNTKDALSSTSPSVLILSHYIWCSGTAMQRAFKGLLCSLLYGLLEKSETLPPDLLTRFPSLSRKDSPDDWSEAELEEYFAQAQATSARPLIMFVDGLDEIDAKEGPLKLLEFVQKMRFCPQTKVCVSSRPEPQLKINLNLFPKLRLQDLNSPDIRQFVEKSLMKSAACHEKINRSTEDFATIIDLVVRKADGVFLWVALALKSLRRGIDNEDSQEILFERLNVLPDDLLQLYDHMWKRLNGDHVFYLGEASLYFNMFLKIDFYNRFDSWNMPFDGFDQRFSLSDQYDKFNSLFDFALRANSPVQIGILNDLRCPSADRLVQLFSDVQKRFQIRCAGLLEWNYDHNASSFTHNRNPFCTSDVHDTSQISAECTQCKNTENPLGADDISELNCDSVHRIQYSHKRLRLRLIHRSAKDFLLSTPVGLNILNYSSFSHEEHYVRAIKASLVYIMWRKESDRNGKYVVPVVGEYLSDPVLDSNRLQLLPVYENMYEKGLLVTSYRRQQCSEDFLGLAASFGLTAFVCKRLAELSERQEVTSEYYTYLLHRASTFLFIGRHHRGKVVRLNYNLLVDWLLTQGGDIDPNKRIAGLNSQEIFLSPFLQFVSTIKIVRNLSHYNDLERCRILEKQVLPTLRRYIAAGANIQSTKYHVYCRKRIFNNVNRCPGFEHVIVEVDAAYELRQVIEHFHPLSFILRGQIERLLEGHAPYLERILAISRCMCDCHIQDASVSNENLGEDSDSESSSDLEDVSEEENSEEESLVGEVTDTRVSETTPEDSLYKLAEPGLSKSKNCCGKEEGSEYPYVLCQDCPKSGPYQARSGVQAYVSVRDEDGPYLLEVLSQIHRLRQSVAKEDSFDPEPLVNRLRSRTRKVISRNRRRTVDIRALLIERGHIPSDEDRKNAVPPRFK